MAMKVKISSAGLKFKVPIVVERDTVGFHAYSPALRGLHMDGDTEEEALNNAKLTAVDFLKIMIEEGIPIPVSAVISGRSRKANNAGEKGYHDEEITINLQ
jgi:predicted RNase H-like HicB family nuclease